jgi:predicted DNA-binding transcriptional regulator AlpA
MSFLWACMPFYLINVKLITDKHLTDGQVAEMTGRAKATLRNDRYYRRGMPFIKAGRSVRYAEDDVIVWMEARKVLTSN